MNVVDSSGWLEYFADAPNAEFFAPAIENSPELLVPAISLYEVFKRVLQQVGEDKALEAVSFMMQGQVVELNALLAINAAKLSNQFKIPMADSIILATARHYEAVLWTQDADFATIPDVQYIPKDTI
ncbi:MAG: type II toxin-antitoxin system VapC family toxin [Chloroflexi bacterium]|nr:type II toxin-antitoxin system VapC family toxin [Chloroflexota bacterium]